MNKKGLIFTILLVVVTPKLYAANETHVRRVQIAAGQVITQEVPMSPGFAAMIEVPSEILSFSIADQTSFSCNKIPPELNKILCKPLTPSPYATNLIVATDKNEFNVILRIDNNGDTHPFKYIFYDPMQAQPISIGVGTSQTTSSSDMNESLLDHLLNDYRTEKCSTRSSNKNAEIRCLEKIRIGTASYLRFKIVSQSRTSFSVVNVSINVQTLGGFTGLSLKSESPLATPYVLKEKTLRFGEEVLGIVKIPNLSVSENQRAVLTVYTDLGQDGDLILSDIQIRG